MSESLAVGRGLSLLWDLKDGPWFSTSAITH